MKGNFTQCAVVLFGDTVAFESIEPFLTEFDLVGEVRDSKDWEFSGPSLTVAYKPEINGYVSVDVVNQPWPDGMGNVRDEKTLFGAWTLGFFGPFAYPNGLLRATQQSRLWTQAAEIVPQHRAFARVRMSYVFGGAPETKIFPENYESLPELDFVTDLAATLLNHPKALCYFNPNGEVLLDKTQLAAEMAFCHEKDPPATRAWTNVRMFKYSESWLLMDCVGSGQLDLLDLEAVFPADQFDATKVAKWLRDVTIYQFQKGERVGCLQDQPVIKDGDTMEGPGGTRWQGKRFRRSIAEPPREVIRLLPCELPGVPPELLIETESPQTNK